MLSNLHIENIAVIEVTEINFDEGLNVLTGETGAGKSIIIGAIGIVLGSRVSRDFIRHNKEFGLVSAVFTDLTKENIDYVKSLGYECEDGALLIHREFNINGKNICKINGRPATVSILKNIGKHLIDVYGQNDSYSLCESSTHINYIDNFGGLRLDLEAYQEVYGEMMGIRKKIELINKNSKDNVMKADILRYQINELESANLISGELDELNKQKEVCVNAEKIKSSINEIYTTLNGEETTLGAVQGIERSVELLRGITEYSSEVEEIYGRLSGVFYELQECALEIQNLDSKFEYDSFELENIEQRLDLLYKLGRKYGESTDDMLKYLEDAKEELSHIEISDEEYTDLNEKYQKLKSKAKEMASELSLKRRKVSKEFVKKVTEELKFLDMPNVEVGVNIEDGELSRNGINKIEIVACINKGDALKPISKIASGGELSRLMLAIKNVLCDDAGLNTLIFDEVDTGVSGSAAEKIGMKLKSLSKKKQVICITHLAQVACFGTTHFLIEKSSINDCTFTNVKKLKFNERCKEIARIIGGTNISEITMKNAEEMLISASKIN